VHVRLCMFNDAGARIGETRAMQGSRQTDTRTTEGERGRGRDILILVPVPVTGVQGWSFYSPCFLRCLWLVSRGSRTLGLRRGAVDEGSAWSNNNDLSIEGRSWVGG
jgi:hypothetical protein